jgi:hypothetical protein
MACFFMSSSCNDINVLQQSPIFPNLSNGKSPLMVFQANNCNYNMGYYLADGIYPKWATFVKPIVRVHCPYMWFW